MSLASTFSSTTATISSSYFVNISSTIVDENIVKCELRKTIDSLLITIAFIVIFTLSIVGNSVVIVTIVQQRTMRSITNIYLLNLAITDLMLSVLCMPPTLISSLVYCWMFGDILCKIFAYLQPVAVAASAYTLAVIAIERYYAICRPLHSRLWQTRAHAIAMISLVWITAFICNIGALFMYEMQSYAGGGWNCAMKYTPIIHLAYQIYLTTVLLLIPLVLMSVLYGYVIFTLRKGMRMDISSVGSFCDTESKFSTADEFVSLRKKSSIASRVRQRFWRDDQSPSSTIGTDSRKSGVNVALNHPINAHHLYDSSGISLRSTHSEKAFASKKRVIRMLLVIVTIFFCCWTPSYVWWLLLMSGDSFKIMNVWNSDVNTIITVLTYISSCTNPITYCFLNSKFREAFLMSIGCRRVKLRKHFRQLYLPPSNNCEMRQQVRRENSTIINNRENDCYDRGLYISIKRNNDQKSTTFDENRLHMMMDQIDDKCLKQNVLKQNQTKPIRLSWEEEDDDDIDKIDDNYPIIRCTKTTTPSDQLDVKGGTDIMQNGAIVYHRSTRNHASSACQRYCDVDSQM